MHHSEPSDRTGSGIQQGVIRRSQSLDTVRAQVRHSAPFIELGSTSMNSASSARSSAPAEAVEGPSMFDLLWAAVRLPATLDTRFLGCLVGLLVDSARTVADKQSLKTS
jgi:hypothetical protein